MAFVKGPIGIAPSIAPTAIAPAVRPMVVIPPAARRVDPQRAQFLAEKKAGGAMTGNFRQWKKLG